MNKKLKNTVSTILGFISLMTGFVMIRKITEPKGILLSLPYLCIGIGCGLLGHGLGNILSTKTMQKHPDIQKQLSIEQNDERNIALANQSKARAYDMMICIFGALFVSFGLMQVDIKIILLCFFAYLFVCGYCIYTRCKLEKEL